MMQQTHKSLLKLLAILCLSACTSNKVFYQSAYQDWEKDAPPTSDIYETVFLLGDAGEPTSTHSARILG